MYRVGERQHAARACAVSCRTLLLKRGGGGLNLCDFNMRRRNPSNSKDGPDFCTNLHSMELFSFSSLSVFSRSSQHAHPFNVIAVMIPSLGMSASAQKEINPTTVATNCTPSTFTCMSTASYNSCNAEGNNATLFATPPGAVCLNETLQLARDWRQCPPNIEAYCRARNSGELCNSIGGCENGQYKICSIFAGLITTLDGPSESFCARQPYNDPQPRKLRLRRPVAEPLLLVGGRIPIMETVPTKSQDP